MYDTTKTVRQFAVEVPQATRVFERLGIDYCCGGGKSLSDACQQAQVQVDDVLRLLNESAETVLANGDWSEASLAGLADYIVTKHHGYVRQESPRLEQLLNKVASKHGDNHPELRVVKSTFALLSEELASHMMKEETILFPYVKEIERAANTGDRMRPPMFGTVRNPIYMMGIEHDSAGRALRKLREVTNGYSVPEDGCFSYRTLCQALAEFEADLHQHIHLENNTLFPRAIQMEAGHR